MYNITEGTTAARGNELGIFETLGDVYSQTDLDLFFSTLARYTSMPYFRMTTLTRRQQQHPQGHPPSPQTHQRCHSPRISSKLRLGICARLPSLIPAHLAAELGPLPNRRPRLPGQLHLRRHPQQLPRRNRRLLLRRIRRGPRRTIPKSRTRRLQRRKAMRRIQTHKRNLHLLRRRRIIPPHKIHPTAMQRVDEAESPGRLHRRCLRR